MGTMNDRNKVSATWGAGRAWPIVVVLLLALCVPTACVLWFMAEAMSNERLAVRQRLTDAYRGQLAAMAKRLDDHWHRKAEQLDQADLDRDAELVMADLVSGGVCDAVIVYDDTEQVVYPRSAGHFVEASEIGDPRWAEAQRLEHDALDPAAAAEAYASFADATEDPSARARALQARARCLLQADRRDDATAALAMLAGEAKYTQATDALGRLIVPGARLLLLELADQAGRPAPDGVLKSLGERLASHDPSQMPTSQRLFLMEQYVRFKPDASFPTQAAELRSVEYLDMEPPRPESPGLRDQSGRWTLSSANGRIVALFDERTVSSTIEMLTKANPPLVGATVRTHHTDRPDETREALLRIPVGPHLADHVLSLTLEGPDPFAAAAKQRNATTLWIGTLGIAAIAILAAVVAAWLGRQMRLTRLKNDLIATVSHELKTPLASMRVLVDTLLDGRNADGEQAREYLALIARENQRLSRLIDNFLTFSRMERNKRAFELAPVDPGDIVTNAVASAGERFRSPACRLDVEIAPDLPPVTADPGAMVTVLLNLLDNAWKYSGDDKHITVRAWANGQGVCFAVSDNGIGLTRRATRKVFGRFYQVDRSLSRTASGCGLGLSIVKFIVDAHDGTVDLASELGEGSTFTITLPANEGGNHD